MQRVVMPTTEAESWTVLDGELEPVGPAEQYSPYLSAIERSPTTVRAYADSLKLWFEFSPSGTSPGTTVGVDSVAQFVAWLRAPAENVIVLDERAAVRLRQR